jgi:EAL domain-containing protein (putative c-di-GMP-specific phosphodiesterase class I)
VRSIIDLGHNLGLQVVAEGVETDQALAELRSAECDVAQGYFLARPMPFERLGSWFSEPPLAAGLADAAVPGRD